MKKFVAAFGLLAVLAGAWQVLALCTAVIPAGDAGRHAAIPARVQVVLNPAPKVGEIGPAPAVARGPEVPDGPAAVPAPHPPDSADRPAFADLPPHQTKPVDFTMGADLRGRLTGRERADQLRDWLLFTVVSQAGLTADQMNRTLYDVPAVRDGYMRPAANFEYGPARSCFIGNGRVVALVPRCGEAERKDYLGRVADEHRKNVGVAPTAVLVFEYDLDVDHTSAAVTRLADLPGADLFTADYGYHEARVGDAASLERFMAEVQDVTFAHLAAGGGLDLGGRSGLSQSYQNIGTEDVAALWQAGMKNALARRAFDAKWKAEQGRFDDRWQGKFDDLRRRYEERARQLESRPTPAPWRLNPNPGRGQSPPPDDGETDVERLLRQLRKQSYPVAPPASGMDGESFETLKKEAARDAQKLRDEQDRAWGDLQKQYAEDLERQTFPQGMGFSLDPTFDFEGLAEDFADFAKPLPELTKETAKPVTRDEIQKILDGLKARDEIPLYQFKARLQKGDDLVGLLFSDGLDQLVERRRFQEARYDGDLGGTKVGMVLFYTDLLAKLWALDYTHNAPGGKNADEARARGAAFAANPLGQLWALPVLAAAPAQRIDDFVPLTDVRVSPIYKKEMSELTHTRLWFGPQNKGFQTADGKTTLLFARNATRIFAKSRTDQSRLESQANAASEAFLGWWNDHYEEVARYEPEYQRLNAAMKWSLLCGWLTDAGQEGRLDFLDSTRTPVGHDSWFPDWCRSRPDLRFHSWEAVAFLPAGYKGSKHEAMKIVYSDPYEAFGDERVLSGGVSLGDVELFKERPGLSALARPTDALGLRGNLDLKALEAGGGRTLRTLDGLEFTFREAVGGGAGDAEVLAQVPAPTKLRGRFEELANRSGGLGGEGKGLNFERTLARDGDGLSVSTRVRWEGGDDTALGSLRVGATRNGFAVDYTGRDVDLGHSLVRRLGGATDPGPLLAGDPDVEAVIRTKDGWLIKQRGGERWLRIQPEKESSTEIPGRWQARAADVKDGAASYDMAWIKPADAAQELGQAQYLRLDVTGPADQRPMIDADARGPPPGGRPLKIHGPGGVDLAGTAGGDGAIYLSVDQLPPEVRNDPAALQRWFGPDEQAGLRAELAKPAPTDGYDYHINREVVAPDDPLVAALERGYTALAARFMAARPEKARLQLNAHLRDGIETARARMAAGRPEEAVASLRKLIDQHGPTPELQRELGVALIARGRATEAVPILEAARTPTTGEDALFNEIRRIQRSAAGDAEKDAAIRKAVNTRVRAILVEGAGPGTTLEVTEGGGGLDSRLPSEPRRASESDLHELLAEDHAILYVEDTPGLNNLDWGPSAWRQTLPSAVEAGRVDLLMLADGDLAHFKPTRIFAPAAAESAPPFRRVSQPDLEARRVVDLLTLGAGAAALARPAAPCDDRDKDKKCFLYFVRLSHAPEGRP